MLLNVHVDVTTSVTVRVEGTVRVAHTDVLYILYILYIYIYPYLPPFRMVDAGVTV